MAFVIHQSVTYTPIDTSFADSDPFLKLHGINVTINDIALSVFNVYVPPASSCPRDYRPNINAIIDNSPRDCLIVGDWNAHSEAWCSAWDDDRGEHLAEAIENSDICILNEDHHTRIPTGANNNQRSSSPDISLISAHLAVAVTWSVSTNLSSDHLPITIAFSGDTDCPQLSKSFTNFHRAKWDGFKSELENLVAALPQPSLCSSGEKAFRVAILTAAKHHIPAGR